MIMNSTNHKQFYRTSRSRAVLSGLRDTAGQELFYWGQHTLACFSLNVQ